MQHSKVFGGETNRIKSLENQDGPALRANPKEKKAAGLLLVLGFSKLPMPAAGYPSLIIAQVAGMHPCTNSSLRSQVYPTVDSRADGKMEAAFILCCKNGLHASSCRCGEDI